ncbi:MAG: DUF3488 domain-containing protein [Acidobacteria bacterium]|nr:DUF3488 domain-containing protein [Acidobacteriota bacterium]
MSHNRRWTAIDPFFEFSLLGLLASGYLAVVGSGYLDGPTAVLTAAGLVLRALLVAGILRFEISPRILNTVTVAYIAFYPVDYYYLSRDFLTATIHLVFYLAIAKILTAVTERDYLYVKVIAFLELLGASVLSSNANYFLFLAMFLLFGVATFAASEIRRSASAGEAIVRPNAWFLSLRLTGLTIYTVAGILVVTAIFFFLLPRTARAAFQRLVPERYHLPGFSNEVALGQIGELKMRNSAVLHARFSSTPGFTIPANLKWRGAALEEFDGKRWFNTRNTAEVLRVEGGVLRVVPLEETLRQARRISYEIVMQEATSDALFLAGAPESIQIFVPLVVRTPANSYRLAFGPSDRLRYRVYAVLEAAGDPLYRGLPLNEEQRARTLRLPPMDPRVADLAKQVAGSQTTGLARTKALESYLHRAFRYTIELPKTEQPDPVAHFLLERKQGHCEYFASAMAVMLRSLGIPSRVATGFQNGLFNDMSGWYLIRASDAHSWVEAWIDGQGWTTFDPTPPDPNPPAMSLGTRLQLYMDAMQVFWQDWVLSYDLDRQFSLAVQVEQSSRSLHLRWFDGSLERWAKRIRSQGTELKKHGPAVIAVIVACVLLAFALPWIIERLRSVARARRVQRGQASASDATLLYLRMLAILRKRGIEKPSWLTPNEFVATLKDEQTAARVREFTSAYHELRYANRMEAAPRLVTLLEQLER